MAKARTSAKDRSKMNPLYKPVGYFSNIVKEGKQFARAALSTQASAHKAKTPMEATKIKSKSWAKYDSAFGQLGGAILQGRRYKDK